MACNAQGQGTITVVEVTTPSVSERRMPSLHACDLPKSSALMINKRASSGYPNKRFVWLCCEWVIFAVSLCLFCMQYTCCSPLHQACFVRRIQKACLKRGLARFRGSWRGDGNTEK